MKLHEYQAKGLFDDYGIAVPKSVLVKSLDEVPAALEAVGLPCVVKAQVHAGARGKGGGVRLLQDEDQVASFVEGLLGQRLVTPQTDATGLPVSALLLEAATAIERELYLGMLVDRASERVTIMASVAGGMDIEAVAAQSPEKILTTAVDPAAGLQGFQVRRLGFGLGLDKGQLKAFGRILFGLYRLFLESDASLVEINPLVVTADGELLALDGKLNLDDNALFRHADLAAMRDLSQEDAREVEAAKFELNYVQLDGDIGCMVNGAGLAMATMDIIKLHGGEPANFLDVGGGTTAQRVAEAFKLIVSSGQVRAILVNIFGGIVRCDLIAQGVLQAIEEVDLAIPVVVRLEGTNVELGQQMLADSDLAVITADDLSDAAAKAVAAAKSLGGV